MVLAILEQIYHSPYFPSSHIHHILVAGLAIVIVHALTQGRKTSRDRDLHARTILLTGAFSSSLGVTLLQELAKRGANVIALTDKELDDPRVEWVVELVRADTGNENVWAEECDMGSLESVRTFATRFLTGQGPSSTEDLNEDGKPLTAKEKEELERRKKETQPPGAPATATTSAPADQRLDAIIFAHEYPHLGSLTSSPEHLESTRQRQSLSTFLLTTLLLPALLIAPVERDIRIINVVNPFYAAAVVPGLSDPSFTSLTSTTAKPKSPFLLEGIRSLRTVVLTRHLQRILDALPSAPQAPVPEAEVVVSKKTQKSNIVAVSVSPSVSRVDTVAHVLGADEGWLGWFLYMILQPLLRIFTKTPRSSVQSVLHALFLPTPFKSVALNLESETPDADDKAASEPASKEKPKANTLKKRPTFREVLKPGALYSECAVVTLPLKPSAPLTVHQGGEKETGKKGKGKEENVVDIEIEDDGEYGGEDLGRRVWEAFESGLKGWEAASDSSSKASKETSKN